MLIFALALAAPTPLTETHQRDIGCVATLAILAHEQKSGGWTDHPDMAEPGKHWAAIVGQRVVRESGQPRELVALAMAEAAKAQLARTEDIETRKDSIADCSLIMYSEFTAIDAANAPLACTDKAHNDPPPFPHRLSCA